MLMHNLQWPEIFLYSEREIITMHLHSWGHIVSGCKVRRRHWAQHRDWVRRDGDPCELFSCAKPGGCGLGLEEIPSAMFSPLSSAVFLGALAAATDLRLDVGTSSLPLLASSMCWVPLSSPLPMVLWAADLSLVSAAADMNQVLPPLQQHPECLLFTLSRIWTWSPWPEWAWIYLQNNTDQCWAIAIVSLLGKSFMSPKARCQ